MELDEINSKIMNMFPTKSTTKATKALCDVYLNQIKRLFNNLGQRNTGSWHNLKNY